MSNVTFARGGGMAKATPKAAPSGASGMGGSALNGTVNGKKGFQVGNKFGAKRKGSSVVAAGGKHRAARKAAGAHIKAGTALSKQGRAAIRDSAAAARELQSARASVAHGRSADAKATRAVASGRAEPLPKPGTKPPPPPVTPPTNTAAVKAGAKEASAAKVERAHDSLKDLHAKTQSGEALATDIHAHVERVARGTTKQELLDAVKKAGIEHKATTKKALVEHLKEHHNNLSKPKAESIPLKDFADRAVAGAHASPGGGFGDEKTFISHAKAHLDKTDPQIAKMSDAEFKAKLVEANAAGHLSLGRADMVGSMHPADVAASSTPHMNVDYHFIRHPEAPGKGQSTHDAKPRAKP